MWGLVFERAWFFALLAPLVLLLIAAHLYRARRRELPVPSLLPWRFLKDRDASGDRRTSRISPRLLLHVLFAAATVAAAAGPGWRSGAQTEGVLLVLLDRSAGMAAPSPRGGSRLDAAKKAILDVLGSRPDRPRVLLRCFPPHPEGDLDIAADRLGEGLDSIGVAQAPGTLARALARTGSSGFAELLGVLAVSDGTGPEFDLPENGMAELVGGPVENKGIEAFSVESLPDGLVRIFIRVRNAGSRDAVLSVSASAGGRSLGETTDLEIRAGESCGRILFPGGIAAPPGDAIEVRIESNDPFPVDDRVAAAPGAGERRTVVLAGNDAPYLSRFLRSDPAVELADLAVPGIGPGMEADLFVFHQRVPASPPRGGVSVVIDPIADFWGMRVNRKKGELALSCDPELDRAAPGLSMLRFRRVAVLTTPPPASMRLVRTGTEAVVVKIPGLDAPDIWFVGLPVDDASSPWPLTPWFPVFWKHLLERASRAGRGAFGYGFHRTGETVRFPLEGGRGVRVLDPDGKPTLLSSRERVISFKPERTGFYRLDDPAGSEKAWAVNLLAPEETALDGRNERRGCLPEPPGTKSTGIRPLRGWSAAIALALLLWILVSEGHKARRLLGPAALLLLFLPPACGSSWEKPPSDTGKGLSPGTPLPPPAQGEATGEIRICPECGKPAGPGHLCGVSAWCEKCGREASLDCHLCGVSRFCPDCGREAALTGHRCGETRFCPICKMEVPLSHTHEKGKEGWGTIK